MSIPIRRGYRKFSMMSTVTCCVLDPIVKLSVARPMLFVEPLICEMCEECLSMVRLAWSAVWSDISDNVAPVSTKALILYKLLMVTGNVMNTDGIGRSSSLKM